MFAKTAIIVVAVAFWFWCNSSKESIALQDDDIINSNTTLPSLLWMAPFYSGGGYCTESLAFIMSLPPAMNFSVAQHGDSQDRNFAASLPRDIAETLQTHSWGYKNADICICHSEPGAWSVPKPAYQTSPCPPPGMCKYKVGRTVFETDRIPKVQESGSCSSSLTSSLRVPREWNKGWPERLNQMDEIWVPGQFSVNSFTAGNVTVPVLAIPEAIDTDFYKPGVEKLRMPFGESKFLFMSVFKWEKRKGWDLLIKYVFRCIRYIDDSPLVGKAFLEEFTPEEASLVIVTRLYHSDANPDEDITAMAKELGRSRSHVYLLSGVPQTQMPSLYAAADAVVQPSRGEGWGRPHQEAMSCGVPVIATNWSGNTAFMNDKNSYLVRIDGMELVGTGAFKDHLWAKPSVEHLKETMRHVSSRPADLAMKAAQARQDMVDKYSYASVGAQLVKQFKRIEKTIEQHRQKRAAASS